MILTLCLLSYLVGSLSFGLMVSRFMGAKDLRSNGSGNIGTANAFRVGGKVVGVLTLLGDMIKTLIIFLPSLFNADYASYTLAFGLCVFMGHLYPIYYGFKGGKGVASFFSLVLFLQPFLGLLFALVWLTLIALTRIASVASLVASLAVFIWGFITLPAYPTLIYGFMVLILFYKHKDNITRLMSHSENTLNGKK